ncbi:MAG: hypothetical protein ABI885_26215 [Gammaproteobacteria bacterium]
MLSHRHPFLRPTNPVYFNYQQRGIASVTSVDPQGLPGIGNSVLALHVTAMTQTVTSARSENAHAAPVIKALLGQISIGSALLAPLQTEYVEWRCIDYAQTNSVHLRAYLSAQQVRAIDALRSSDGGFELDVALVALIQGGEGLLRAPYDSALRKRITASDWTRILTEMHFEDRATFEIPIEGGRVGPPFHTAAAHMRAALDRLRNNLWPDALKESREVLDELQRVLPLEPPEWAEWSNRQKREAWSLRERVAVMQVAVRHVTHAGAHAPIGAPGEHEARLVVRMVGVLLDYCASRSGPP